MAEGYQCDRCGSTHGGGPDTMLIIGEGRERGREAIVGHERQEYDQSLHPLSGDVEFDLCQGCRNDFRSWWGDAGHASRSDISELREGDA